MKKTTKFISLLLAVLMVMSSFAGLTFTSVSAAEEGQQIIYFEFPTDGSWGDPKQVNVNKSGKAMVYCYVYAVYGNQEQLTKYAFGAKKTMATPVNGSPADGNTLYAFDLSTYGTIEDGASYGVIWSTTNPTTNKTYQTTDITMDYSCLGDTIYVTESVPTRENSSDSDKKDFCAAWKNNKNNGVKGGITSLNNLLEGYFPTSMPKAKPMSDALKKYLTNPTNNPFFQWQQTEISAKKNGGWNEKTIEALGTTPLDVYNQYMADNAENIEGAEIIYPDGVKDKTPVPYISYEGYNDNAKLVTLKMAAPEAVAAVLNLSYPPAEPTTAHVHSPAAPVKENVVPASCTKEGSYDEVVKCADCGEELSREHKTTDKIAHTPGEAAQENVVPASCTKEGSYDLVVKCTECGTELSREHKTTDKIAHTPGEPTQENVVAASCTKEGSYDEVVKCTECGTELSREHKTNAKLAHVADTPVKENVVPADCEKDGSYDEVTYCKNCNTEIKRETKTTTALGHDVKFVAEVPATEDAEGVKEHYACSRCTKLFSDAEAKNEVTADSLVIPKIVPTQEPTEPVAETAYSIAGSSEEIFGAKWDASNISTDMTKGDDGKYTITFNDVQPAENVEFKVVVNHSWDESYGDKTGANVKFNVTEACDVTVTFDPETKEITVAGDGVTQDTELIVDVVRAVGNGQDNWLNGSDWDPDDDINAMSKVSEGVYEITFNDIDEDLNYQIKFAVNGGWANNFGAAEDGFVATSGEQFDAAYNGKNIYVHVDEDGSTVKAQLDLTNFDYATKQGAKVTITVTAPATEPTDPTVEPTTAPVEPTDPTVEPTEPTEPTEPAADKEYSIAGSSEDIFGAKWDATNISTDMTKGDDGKYTITFNDVQPAENVEFKVVVNHSWDESYGDKTGANVKFNVTEACDVTVTFDPETKEITVAGDGVTQDTELIVDVVRAVGNGQDNWLNGSDWDPDDDINAMSKVSEGVYEITFNDIDEDLNYQIKFAVNGGWANNFGAAEDGFVATSGEQFDAAYNGKNIYVHVDEDGSTVKAQLDLTNFDYATKQGAKVTITVTAPEKPVGTVYGDVDGDGQVTIDDATLIQKALVKMVDISAEAEAVGDVNGDGHLSIMDVTFIQRYLAGNTGDGYGYKNLTGTEIPKG